MAAKQLSDGNTDGTTLGQSASDKISFYGVTPVVRRAGSAQAAVPTTAATASSPYGYSEAQANAIVTLVNEMRTVLVNAGLMKGAA